MSRIILSLAAFFLSTTVAIAASSVRVGIPAAQFDSVASSQAKDEWCWAASIQMVLNWHGVAVTQKDIVNRVYGKAINAAATEDAITQALSGTAYTHSLRRVTIYSQHYAGAPDPDLLLREMQKRQPILITFRTGEHRLHAVVITAAEYAQSSQGPVVTSLLLRDPKATRLHPGGATIRVSGRDLARFLPNITGCWPVEVY